MQIDSSVVIAPMETEASIPIIIDNKVPALIAPEELPALIAP